MSRLMLNLRAVKENRLADSFDLGAQVGPAEGLTSSPVEIRAPPREDLQAEDSMQAGMSV